MPNSLTIVPNGTRPKVIETGNYIIIMDQMYNKKDLTCINNKTCTFDNIIAGNNILNIYTHMYLTGSLDLRYSADRHKRKTVWQDGLNQNRYYLIVNEHYSNQQSPGSYLVCVEENNDDINLIYKIKYSTDIKEILDESENYLYAWGTNNAHWSYSSYGHNDHWYGQTVIYEIDKSTGNNVKTFRSLQGGHISVGKVNLLYKDQEKFAYIVNYNGQYTNGDYHNFNYNTFYFDIYNKQSRSFIQQSTQSFSADKTHNEKYEDLLETNDGKRWYTYFNSTSGNGRWVLNYNTNNNNLERYNDSMTDVIRDPITLQYPNDYHNLSIDWIVDNYLYILIYNGAQSSLGNAQKLYIYQCNKNYENIQNIFVYYNQQSFNNVIRSMVYNSDKTVLLIGYNLSFEIFILNPITHLYETSGKVLSNIVSAGFDETDRLWYQDANGAVYAENLEDPLTVVPEFEKIYYTYSNTNINTYLTFSAKSFTKKPAFGKYILTLSDNAYFVETNDQILEINYTGDDTIHYPLVITGPKKVSCSTVFEKVW